MTGIGYDHEISRIGADRGNAMTTVAIREKYVEALTPFGNLEQAIDLALQRYTIEQITTKLAELRRRDKVYQDKFGMEYPSFVSRIAEDESFVADIERGITKTWELDLADWEFCYEGGKDWTRRLQNILLA